MNVFIHNLSLTQYFQAISLETVIFKDMAWNFIKNFLPFGLWASSVERNISRGIICRAEALQTRCFQSGTDTLLEGRLWRDLCALSPCAEMNRRFRWSTCPEGACCHDFPSSSAEALRPLRIS